MPNTETTDTIVEEVSSTEIEYEYEVPLAERYLLTVNQTAALFNIGYKSLKRIVHNHPNDYFYLTCGNRIMFKTKLFAQFLDEATAI